MGDHLDELLGIDAEDPVQRLATMLVESDASFLEHLVAMRRAKGLTQGQVGQLMGITQPAVAALERADADPKLSTIRRYALAVGALVRHIVVDFTVSVSPVLVNTTQPKTRSVSSPVEVRNSNLSSSLLAVSL